MFNNQEPININLTLFGVEMGTETAEVPEVTTTETSVETPEVTPTAHEGIQREDFANAPFLRQFRKEPEKTETSETTEKPEEEPPVTDTHEVKTEEPAATPDETVPEVFMLPDGREVTTEQITEWEKGHMMQADYTKKTQQLADERKQFQAEVEGQKQFYEQADKALNLWQAFEIDPIGTIEQLQEHYASQGIFEAKPKEAVEREMNLRQREQEVNRKQQEDQVKAEQEAYNNLINQFDTLAGKYSDFDGKAVAQYMIDNSITDPEKAYKAMTHDTVTTAKSEAEAKAAEAEARAAEIEAKAKKIADEAVNNYIKEKVTQNNTPPPVGASGGGGSPPVQINRPKTMRDAKLAALSRLSSASQ